MNENEKIEHTFLGFNRKEFIKGIFEKDFNANVRSCAMALNMTPNYLHDLVYTPTREAGIKTLSKIMQYCKKTGKDYEKYILIEK
ncbi:MAG: hypothetical protein ACRC76_12895 [Proteocatella sp.]